MVREVKLNIPISIYRVGGMYINISKRGGVVVSGLVTQIVNERQSPSVV